MYFGGPSAKKNERKREDEQDLLPPADLYINCLVGRYACSSPCKRIVMVMKVPRVGVVETVQSGFVSRESLKDP